MSEDPWYETMILALVSMSVVGAVLALVSAANILVGAVLITVLLAAAITVNAR